MSERHDLGAADLRRREFLKVAATAAAAGGVYPAALSAAAIEPSALPRQQAQEVPPIPLGQGEAPAVQFQAYPGGTGALMERLWREHGAELFERHPIEIAPWTGPVPTDEVDLAFLPVHRLSALVREGHVSSVELTEIYLERIKRHDPELLFVVTLLEGRAREEAQQADTDLRAGRWRGPLHGIPYGVKDLFSVRGARTTWGSADFEDQVIDEDAELVVRLREAGAVLLAKLSTGEFAQGDRWYRGQTRNPWNPEQGSSGSSAGPGSATAAGCVAFAIGTETRGSIVSPSRRNGLTGFRPTFGRISRHGGMVLSWTMDKPGPMCRTAMDCALVFNAIHGSDEKDPSTITAPFRFDSDADLSAFRIGYDESAPEAFVEALRELGADPSPMPEMPDVRIDSLGAESAAAFDYHVAPGGELPPMPEGLTEAEQRRMNRFRRGRDVLAMDYIQSQRRRRILMQRTAEAMEGFDLFVSGSGQVRLTNDTGHPAVVLPYGFGDSNPDDEYAHEQPITTTIVGDLFADDKILAVAHAYQSATDWHTRRPPLE